MVSLLPRLRKGPENHLFPAPFFKSRAGIVPAVSLETIRTFSTLFGFWFPDTPSYIDSQLFLSFRVMLRAPLCVSLTSISHHCGLFSVDLSPFLRSTPFSPVPLANTRSPLPTFFSPPPVKSALWPNPLLAEFTKQSATPGILPVQRNSPCPIFPSVPAGRE